MYLTREQFFEFVDNDEYVYNIIYVHADNRYAVFPYKKNDVDEKQAIGRLKGILDKIDTSASLLTSAIAMVDPKDIEFLLTLSAIRNKLS